MLKFILIGIAIVAVVLFFEALLPSLKQIYRSKKEKKQKHKAFVKKMKELEIK